jgi:thiamine-monophosphate kinase
MTDRLCDRGERALLEAIRRLIPRGRGVRLGPGDDAAVLSPLRSPLLLTTDAMVERVHFRSRWLSPRDLGRRAFEVSASDVAAMGGRVVAAVLALTAPPTLPVASLRAIVGGVRDGARAAGGALVGGNLASGPDLSLTLTVLGTAAARPVTRAGARAGDHLFVTGTLGGAGLGLRSLMGARSISGAATAVGRWTRPRARLRAGAALARRGVAVAMIDLSDGLLIDADRLCAASGVGARIDADRLPLARALRGLAPARARELALTGGEDYELLFAVRPARVATLHAARAALGCQVTRVGEVVAGRGVTVLAGGHAIAAGGALGYEHFARSPRRRRRTKTA